MQTGMCFAKAVDNRNILSRLPTWWNDICSHTGMEPGMGPIPQEKTKRGFSDLVCGMLLCPVELNWDDVQYVFFCFSVNPLTILYIGSENNFEQGQLT